MKRTIVKPVVSAIWAQTQEGIIGVDGELPFHIPNDLKFYKRMTTGHTVIVGRKTYDSLPAAAFKNRQYYYATQRAVANEEHACAHPDYMSAFDDATAYAMKEDQRQVFIAGGESAYQYFLAKGLLDEILITRVLRDVISQTERLDMERKLAFAPIVTPDYGVLMSSYLSESAEFEIKQYISPRIRSHDADLALRMQARFVDMCEGL